MTAGVAAPAAIGTRVTVSVRPEHVKLGPAVGDSANRWPARVVDVTFMGAIVRARVAVDGGPVLAAEVQNDAAGGLTAGAPVETGWSPGHTVVLAH